LSISFFIVHLLSSQSFELSTSREARVVPPTSSAEFRVRRTQRPRRGVITRAALARLRSGESSAILAS
jgi:hypothetical protein